MRGRERRARQIFRGAVKYLTFIETVSPAIINTESRFLAGWSGVEAAVASPPIGGSQNKINMVVAAKEQSPAAVQFAVRAAFIITLKIAGYSGRRNI